MALELAGGKKKQKAPGKYTIITIDLYKPTKKKNPIVDYEELRKSQLEEGESSGDDERFHDREALEMVRRLEERYGGATKKKKKKRFGTEEDFIDKTAGYELDDPFIDDSEAYDELIPSNMDTLHGGFYVNKGKLEFKEKYATVDMSDLSEDEEELSRKKNKRVRPESDDDIMEVDEAETAKEKATKSSEAPVAAPPAPKQNGTAEVVRPRMMGAPPTKKFASLHNDSPSQRAAKAILKKRLVGHPSQNKNRLIKNIVPVAATALAVNAAPAATASTSPKENIAIENVDKEKAADPSASASANAAANVATGLQQSPMRALGMSINGPRMVGSSPHLKKVFGSPKKAFPQQSDALSTLLKNFKASTSNLAVPGMKKRLQNTHVDQVIAIDEQCVKDGMSVHEKAKILHHMADYCGIQKNSLYARVQKRKEELKGGVQPAPATTAPGAAVPAAKPSSSNSSGDECVVVIDPTPKTPTPSTVINNRPKTPTVTKNGGTSLMSVLTPEEMGKVKTVLEHIAKNDVVSTSDLQILITKPKSFAEFMTLQKEFVDKKVAAKLAAASAASTSSALPAKVIPKIATASPMSKVVPKASDLGRLSKISLADVIRKIALFPTPKLTPLTDDKSTMKMLEKYTCTMRDVIVAELTKQKLSHDATKPGQKMKFEWNTGIRQRFMDCFNDLWTLVTRVTARQPSSVFDQLVPYIAQHVIPNFQGSETFTGLVVLVCRHSPEKSKLLLYDVVQKMIMADKIDLSKEFVFEESLKSISHMFAASSNGASKSASDDDIQLLDDHGNLPKTLAAKPPAVNPPQEPSTSTANGTHSAVTPSRPANNLPPGVKTTPPTTSNASPLKSAADMVQLQQLFQMAAASGNAQALQQAAAMLALQAQTSQIAMQHAAQQTQKEQERKRIQEEKEKRQKEKEEKIRLAAEKKAEKVRMIEEKKRLAEEEKKRKAEEKAKKEEEERQRRLQEQQEKERRIQEERMRKEQEERERKKREEEEEQRRVALRVKQEAVAEEEERIRRQEEQAEAARAAAMARDVKPMVQHLDIKPALQQGPYQMQQQSMQQGQPQHPQQQGFVPPQAGFQSPAHPQQPVPQSPQFPAGSPFMGNQGGMMAQSPQQQHNFNQPQQSPYQMQHQSPHHHVVQSPVNRMAAVPNSPQQQFAQQNTFQNGQQQAMFQQPNASPYQQQAPFGSPNAMIQQRAIQEQQQREQRVIQEQQQRELQEQQRVLQERQQRAAQEQQLRAAQEQQQRAMLEQQQRAMQEQEQRRQQQAMMEQRMLQQRQQEMMQQRQQEQIQQRQQQEQMQRQQEEERARLLRQQQDQQIQRQDEERARLVRQQQEHFQRQQMQQQQQMMMQQQQQQQQMIQQQAMMEQQQRQQMMMRQQQQQQAQQQQQQPPFFQQNFPGF